MRISYRRIKVSTRTTLYFKEEAGVEIHLYFEMHDGLYHFEIINLGTNCLVNIILPPLFATILKEILYQDDKTAEEIIKARKTERLNIALKWLVDLKALKDARGSDDGVYVLQKPKAWELAREALAYYENEH